MLPPLPELPDFSICNPQFAVDCNDKPVEGEDHFPGIFLVHASRLVPDHFLPEQRGEFFDFGSLELLRKRESLDVIPDPVPCLLRGQGEVLWRSA